ncbi:MAG: hypothetical protein R3F40_02875 [Candidatus Competibacteraceae bacterium]
MARIDALDISELTPHQLEPAFVIAASGAGAVSADITPDTAVCEDCLAELFDPGDRRYRYPSSTAPTAVPATPSPPPYPTTAPTPAWPASSSARPARGNTTTPATAAFMPSPTPVRSAVLA